MTRAARVVGDLYQRVPPVWASMAGLDGEPEFRGVNVRAVCRSGSGSCQLSSAAARPVMLRWLPVC